MNDMRLEFINGTLGTEELLTALAEEASELAHAALKLRRAVSGKDPTPVKADKARKSLEEELTDVMVTADALGIAQDDDIREAKIDRWTKRLLSGILKEAFDDG